MKSSSLILILASIASVSQNAQAQRLCGQVRVDLPPSLSAGMPSHFIDTPNPMIPEEGYVLTYTLVDNGTPVLKDLVNGKHQCVEGEQVSGVDGEMTFRVERVVRPTGVVPRVFTEVDYSKIIEDTGVEFRVTPVAREVLDQILGGGCDKAALASVAHAVFNEAQNRGVDFPELIDVQAASYDVSKSALDLTTQGARYRISLGSKSRLCTARVYSVIKRN